MSNKLIDLVEELLPETDINLEEKTLQELKKEYPELDFDHQLERHLDKWGLGYVECPNCGSEMELADKGHRDDKNIGTFEGMLRFKCPNCGEEVDREIHY